MSTTPLECPRCRGRMESGAIVDRGDLNIAGAQQWMEGPAEASKWGGIKTKGRQLYQVNTYRCERCGYLESYANEAIS